MASHENVIGYDLINEPCTEKDYSQHWMEIEERAIDPSETAELIETYKSLITAVRSVDHVTPIIVEPAYWANVNALAQLDIDTLRYTDPCSNILVSVHFYSPQTLTFRTNANKCGESPKFAFPGLVPVSSNLNADHINWTTEKIQEKLREAKCWAKQHGVEIFVGEFGCSRDIKGADHYLKLEEFIFWTKFTNTVTSGNRSKLPENGITNRLSSTR